MSEERQVANQRVLGQLQRAEPWVLDVRPAIEVVPGMEANMVLTAGAPLAWEERIAAQRMAVLGGAVHEGLAPTFAAADKMISRREIVVASTHDNGCVGPHAGIITASTPVFVVVDRATDTRAYCSVFEGDASPRRLSLGFYDDDIKRALRYVEEVIGPTLGAAIRALGGLALSDLIRDSLALGDDGHVRSRAGTVLFVEALVPAMLELASDGDGDNVRRTLEFLRGASYTFLRPWMAADKAITRGAERNEGRAGSSIVTVMSLSCREFAIQIAGLPSQWFRGPHPSFCAEIDGRLYQPGEEPPPDWGWWFGADSMITECLGFGGFAAAAAFGLAGTYLRGHRPGDLIERTNAMYDITVGEHPTYTIPYLGHRGVPLGIDIYRVLETGILPAIHGGISKRDGSAFVGATVYPPMRCFELAAAALEANGA